MQNKRSCEYCRKLIPPDAHKRRKYCSDKCRLNMYRRKNNLPTTAHGEHYQFWKALHQYTFDELRVLFRLRKERCKYANSWSEILKYKKEMKIIGMVYEELKNL